MPLAARTIVYHCTNPDAIRSILTRGIRNVSNAWGGGALGPGFYAATSFLGAAGYANTPQHGVLEITTKRLLNGQGVVPPPGFDYSRAGRAAELARLCATHDYLWEQSGHPPNEYKFNQKSKDALAVDAVHIRQPNGQWRRYLPYAYLDDL